MGCRDDNEQWNQLEAPVLQALDGWLEGKSWDIRFRSWFKDGRSGSPVAVVARSGPGTDDQVVLKFFLGGAVEVRKWNTAWDGCPLPWFRDEHLVGIADDSGSGGTRKAGPWIASLKIAGGNLARFRPLAELSPTGNRFSEACRTIVTSVVADWNDYPGRKPSIEVTVGEYLHKMIDYKRLTRGANYRTWASSTDIPVKDSLISRRDGELLPNPLRIIGSTTFSADQRTQMLRGCAHGDLHVRNILLPIRPPKPHEYKLIDLGDYADDAPLARDPMNLLLSIAFEWMLRGIDFESKLSRSLIEAIVNPDGNIDAEAKPYQEVSQAIHSAGRTWAENDGWGEDWTQQSLLSLVAYGLRFIGRDLPCNDPDMARKWFFELAAAAARNYMIRVNSWGEYQQKDSARRVGTRRQAAADQLLSAEKALQAAAPRSAGRKAKGAQTIPSQSSSIPSRQNTDTRATEPGTPNQGTWSDLASALRDASLDGSDWTALAASSEPLRQELSRERSPYPASDEQISGLLQDLSDTLAAAMKKSATSAQLSNACSRVGLLRKWLLSLLAEPEK